MPRQRQEGGDHSTNIQAENINVTGITYADARDIALDVFRANFMELTEHAGNLARERAEEVTEKFLSKLQNQNAEGIGRAQDPDFQYALFTVQKEYARTGDEDLGDLLVDLLVDRTKHDSRTILQIVLNESLAVAPKLTTDQLSALSIIFILKYTINHSINNLPSLGQYLDTYIQPFADSLLKNASCYQHLEFAGCGSISIGGSNLGDMFRQKYGGVFSKGFSHDELQNRQIETPPNSPIFVNCLHDPAKLQLNAMSEEILRSKAVEIGVDEQETNRLVGLNNSFLMNGNEVKDYLVNFRPYMSNVFETWEESFMKNMNLTSVGIAIGHANAKRQLGEFTDLSIWIN